METDLVHIDPLRSQCCSASQRKPIVCEVTLFISLAIANWFLVK